MINVKLIPLSGKNEIQVEGPVFSLGREPECDHQIFNMQVSRHHCDLYVNEESVLLRDRGSRNGTFVNGEMVLGEHQLRDDDTLAIGPVLFTISIDKTEESDAPRFLRRIRSGMRRLARN